MIRDSGASIVVGGGRQAEALEAIAASAGARFIRTADLLAGDGRGSGLDDAGGASPTWHRRPIADLTPARRAMILYTSGTTGTAEGGRDHARELSPRRSRRCSRRGSGRATTARCWCCRCITCTASSTCWAAPSPPARACEILPQFEPEAAWERLASGEITVFSAVPTIYHRLIQSFDAAPPAVQRARADGCRRVRLMMSGSAALPVRTLERWREISGHTLLERYGMTETGHDPVEPAARRAAARVRRHAAARRRGPPRRRRDRGPRPRRLPRVLEPSGRDARRVSRRLVPHRRRREHVGRRRRLPSASSDAPAWTSSRPAATRCRRSRSKK